ncbi:hypothetical protein BIWAKO_02866 [Bosea sp. BIWAKO-01]|nr:hypothetical protein BIWAKO_02866 [Bosea sp. BIWAKO-01]
MSACAFGCIDERGGKDIVRQPPPQLRQCIVSTQVNKAGQGDDAPMTIAPSIVQYL